MLSNENDLRDGLESIGKTRCISLENVLRRWTHASSKVNNRSAWIWVKNFYGQPAATQHGTLPGKGSLRQIFLKNKVNVLPF